MNLRDSFKTKYFQLMRKLLIDRIYALSSSELIGHQMINEDRRLNLLAGYEIALVEKWNTLLDDMIERCNEQQRKRPAYFPKQMEYIAFIFRTLLTTRAIIQSDHRVRN